ATSSRATRASVAAGASRSSSRRSPSSSPSDPPHADRRARDRPRRRSRARSLRGPRTRTSSPAGGVDQPVTTTTQPAGSGATTSEGVRLIARFVRRHPGPFVVSPVGGGSWAAPGGGPTYVLGRVTDEVIEPGFSGGVPASTVWWAVAALLAVAVLRGLSVVLRRWFGSLTEARMQASLRRDVADTLLRMPM